ncbi:uncharacterized protein LOC134182851 [Corticium candelabrum]|uniref:uncharacterized protein LOC134182851 n=1 Tax=Corticium candelabrum TaxID=121492 RepID=UPI002E256435|nr:uncharacterized protein LOC134182851 [Corticium candelabrum]
MSRYPEIVRLSDATSNVVIEHMKFFFSRHGITEEVRSNNGPQYSSAALAKFASEYEFLHINSSPLHPQSNGEAERMRTDFRHLNYFMGRQIRSVVPKLPQVLHPRALSWKEILKNEAIGKEDKKRRFNKRHVTKVLKPLTEGTTVWETYWQQPGKVLQDESTPRSYGVQIPSTTVPRNRRHLVNIPPSQQQEEIPVKTPNPNSTQGISKLKHLHKKVESHRIHQNSGQGVEDE